MNINTNKCSVSVFKVIYSLVFFGMCSEFCSYNCRTVRLFIIQSTYTQTMDGKSKYEGWNFNSGNYLFTTDTK